MRPEMQAGEELVIQGLRGKGVKIKLVMVVQAVVIKAGDDKHFSCWDRKQGLDFYNVEEIAILFNLISFCFN